MFFQALYAFFQTGCVIAQSACNGLLGCGARTGDEQGVFFGKKFCDTRLEAVENAAMNSTDCTEGIGDAVPTLIAENPSQIFFGIPGKVLEDKADYFCKFCIALNR